MDVLTARALLGVSCSADAEQIKRAYRGKAREAHPDCGGTATTFARLVDAQGIALQHVPTRMRRRSPWLTEGRTTTKQFFAVDVPPSRRTQRSGGNVSEAASSNRSFGDVLAREIAAA